MTNLSVEEDYEIEGLLADTEVAEVKGTVLTNKMNAHNTFDAPEVVKTEEFNGCKVVDNKLVFTIPACSVLHLEVTVK
jgi:alpha-N-arabinofuranosidase